MSRIRAEFRKGEEVRFIGHLDILRTFERALRRAELPVAMTQGFNPRQKISFASPLSLGLTGERELVDIELTRPLPPEEFKIRLNAALPSGLRLVAATEVPDHLPALMADLEWADYLAEWQEKPAPGRPASALELFLQQPEIIVVRQGKKGERRVDIRPAVLRLEDAGSDEDRIRVTMRLSLSGENTARPAEVLDSLRRLSGLEIADPVITRLRLGLAGMMKERV